MRSFRPQHPEPAYVQGGPGGHAGPGRRRVGRGQGHQQRRGLDKVVRRVGRDPLRRVLCHSLVPGGRHVTRDLLETGKRSE